MSLAVCLLAYGLVVAVLGPDVLERATRSGAAPRLGIAVWSAAMVSVLGSWLLTVALLGGEVLRAGGELDRLLAGCVETLRVVAQGGHGELVRAGLAALVGLSLLAVAVLAWRLRAALRRGRIRTRRHAEEALLVGRGRTGGPAGAIVLDSDDRRVYCIAGRPPTIVITRGALAALDTAQLDAVLAHERAHLKGRHHLLLALTGAMARILPGMRLFVEGAASLARLVEMRADDAAARHHGSDTVVDALLALTTASAVPAAALSAAAIGVADRVERLLFPSPGGRTLTTRLVLGGAVAALVLGPLAAIPLIVTQSPLCITALSAAL